ncbi:MAG: 30S ribosomal protein S4 [Candidatus Aminicenantes bacterium]|nr:30S ribosomal protein S4 [Candidatus Aminicenantes bacterium]
MGRQRDRTCRYCRVERTKLFLKGHKCMTDKCPVERRPYPPGEHGRARRRILGYGIQLREKQKLKRYYGMSEKQFRLFFKRAERKKGITGENLLAMLERRLDNVVYLVGFAHSRTHARQLITHGHFRINDHKVNIPSLLVEKEDLLSLQDKSTEHEELDAIVEAYKNKEVPPWLEVDSENQKVRVVSYPQREDVPLPIEEHLIVELYSK